MKHSIKILVLCLATLLLVASCKPTYPNIGRPETGITPFYEEGWNDGCETGLAAYGTSIYKTFYRFKQQPELTTNQVYYQAWNDAMAYCRQFALRWANQGSIDEVDNIFGDAPFPAGVPHFYNW